MWYLALQSVLHLAQPLQHRAGEWNGDEETIHIHGIILFYSLPAHWRSHYIVAFFPDYHVTSRASGRVTETWKDRLRQEIR
jgi:hypothetical protein